MIYSIYALRVIGELEARYIGQTAYEPDKRRACLIREAGYATWSDDFRGWLLDNKDRIEAVTIGTAATRQDALRAESQAMSMFHAFGHRLLNRQGLPRAAQELEAA